MATNSDGNIVLSVTIDKSNVGSEIKNLTKLIEQSAKAESKTATQAERLEQAKLRTAQQQQKLLQQEQKTSQEKNKTLQSEEKVKQSVEKTKQSVEKTTQAQNKTTEAINKSKKATNSWESATNNITSALGKTATALGIVFGIRELLRFSNEASKVAAQTEAYIQRIGQIYGEAGKQVYDFVDANSQALGMSKAVAYEAAANYGNLFSSFADGAENAQLTNEMLNATAVIASKTGRSFDEVFTKIQSGIFGNTRAIDDLGVYVNQATLQYTQAFRTISDGRPWAQLTGNEQKQVLTLAILEQAQAKYGNTVLQSTALARSQFNAAFQDFKATWGTLVNLILIPVLNVVTTILNAATLALKAVLKLLGKDVSFSGGAGAGISVMNTDSAGIADNLGAAADNQKKLGKGVKDTNKELKKTLANFDEINILTEKTAGSAAGGGTGGGAAGGGAGSATVATPAIEITDAALDVDITPWESLRAVLEKISLIFMSGFWLSFQNADFSGIKTSLDDIGTKLKGLFSSQEITSSISRFSTSVLFSLGQITGSIASIGTTVAENFVGGFNIYLDTNTPFLQKSIAGIFDAGADIAASVGNLWSAFANIFSVYASQNGKEVTAAIIGIFSNASLGIIELALKTGNDFMNFLVQPIVDNQEKLRIALDGLLGTFSTLLNGIKIAVDNLVNNVLETYDKHVSPFIQTLTDVVSEWVDTFVTAYTEHVQPIIDEFAEDFTTLVEVYLSPMFDTIFELVGKLIDIWTKLWDEVLKPLGAWVIDSFVNSFSETFAQVKDIFMSLAQYASDYIKNITDDLNGLIDFLTGIFTGDWEKAWSGIKKIIFATVNSWINALELGINAIINGINSLLGGLRSLVNTVGDALGLDWTIPRISTVHLKRINVPALAQGAVIPPNKSFLAVLGDQKSGTNIEAPLDTIKQAVAEVLQTSNLGGGDQTIILQLDGREVGRTFGKAIQKEQFRAGTNFAKTKLVF